MNQLEILEILYDHYKETVVLNKEAQARRNRSFIILCVLEAFSFLFLINPQKAHEIIVAGINLELDSKLQLSISVIQSLLWILIAYVIIRYVQDVLYIERQYIYLDNLEKKISSFISDDIFKREGDNYLDNYPIVLNFIDLFYKMLMPILFIAINGTLIFREWILFNKTKFALICDTILFLAIFIITWFYFFQIHSRITKFCMEHIPFIKHIGNKLRNLLKYV